MKVVALAAQLLVACACLVGCAPDWGSDHEVVNQLPVLPESSSWVLVRDVPATPVECSTFNCQNVVRGVHYEVLGDPREARSDVIAVLSNRWKPTVEIGDSASVHFQLRDDSEILTTTGTAYLRASFVEDLQVSDDEFVPNAVVITLSSDSEI